MKANVLRGGAVTIGLVVLMIFLFLMTPVEQTLDYTQWYPNVIVVWTEDNKSTMVKPYLPLGDSDVNDMISPVDIKSVRGVYQYQFMHWSSRMEKALKTYSESFRHPRVWECVAFCEPASTPTATLKLVHLSPVDKPQDMWLLMEVEEENEMTPVVLARSKRKRFLQLTTPFVQPNSKKEGKDVPEVPLFLTCAWHLASFDTNFKIGVWSAIGIIVIFLIGSALRSCQDEDSDDEHEKED